MHSLFLASIRTSFLSFSYMCRSILAVGSVALMAMSCSEISYTLTESEKNDGSFEETIVIENFRLSASNTTFLGFIPPGDPTSADNLTKDQFDRVRVIQGGEKLTQNKHYTIEGKLPSGLSVEVVMNQKNEATLHVKGMATDHAPEDNRSFTIIFSGYSEYFCSSTCIYVTSANTEVKINLVFVDPVEVTPTPTPTPASTLSYSATSFSENSSNAGGVSDTVTATLSDATFVNSSGAFTQNTHYTISNVPTGLTAVLTATSSTTAVLSLTGAASSHANANDISNLTLTFLSAAFTGGNIPTNGSQSQAFSVNFSDSFILLYNAGAQGGNLGGRSGADGLCVSEKPSGAYQTNVRALISVSGADEIRDMVSNYSVPTTHEIKSESGNVVANNWADLLDGSIDMNLLSAGVLMMPVHWWSGSDNTGALGTNHCLGWTSDSSGDAGDVGFGSDTADWFNETNFTCDGVMNEAALLCIAFE